jgi:hypothetical protein
MSRNGDEDDAIPMFDDKSNSNNNEESSKTRASTDCKHLGPERYVLVINDNH